MSSENEGAGSRDPKLGSEKQWVGIGATAPKALRDLAGSVRTLVDRMLRGLVEDGRILAYDGDMDDYRAWLLGSRGKKNGKENGKKNSKDNLGSF